MIATIAGYLTLTFACGVGSTGMSPQPSGPADSGPAAASPIGPDGANGDDTFSPRAAPSGGGMSTEPPASQDAGPPALRFIGRFDTRDAQGPTCAWPGCRIIANWRGTDVTARLDEHVESWMQGGPSEWDVAIDGELKPKLVLDLGAHEYVLATGLPDGEHRVELYKRSETQNGYTQFLGYDFGGGTLLPPPLPAPRRIEFVGDSQPAAFGIEGVGLGPECPGPNWAARWQNFHKSMGARLGEILNADLNGTIYSGKGFVRNIYRPDPDTMPIIYPRANPLDPNSLWDFTMFVPDVIVVMMGANDFAIGQPEDNGPTSLPEFTQATRGLLATFRGHSPRAHVFLALSPSVYDEEPAGRQSRTNVKTAFDAVANEHAAAGDRRVYSVAPPIAAQSELTACDGHGNPAYHERVAQQLAVMVRAKTGW